MSGPSVKIPATWLDSDVVEDLGADTVLLMITALAHSAEQISDGIVPRRTLRKLWPVADIDAAVDRLIKAGEVEDHGDRLLFVHWRDFILEADEVERIRANNRQRDQRRRRHNSGDHSMCQPKYCQAAAREQSRENSREATREDGVSSRVSHGDPIRSDPTRPLGRGGEGGGSGTGSAGATPGPAPGEQLVPHEHSLPRGVDPEDCEQHACQDCGLGYYSVVHWAHEFLHDDNLKGCLICSERYEYGEHVLWEQYVTARDDQKTWPDPDQPPWRSA